MAEGVYNERRNRGKSNMKEEKNTPCNERRSQSEQCYIMMGALVGLWKPSFFPEKVLDTVVHAAELIAK